MTTRYAIIGSGMMGHEHIRNIKLLDGAQVVAVADPSEAMRLSAAGLAGGNCDHFSNYREMLARCEPDALVIAAPNQEHYPILLDVMGSGLPTLIEKPLCISVEQCLDIRQRMANIAAPFIWVAMEYRYMPPVARLIEEAAQGSAGVVRMISIREHRFPFLQKVGNWNRFQVNTGGTLVEKCCHFFDLMRLVAGAEPIRVYASGGQDVNFVDDMIDGRKPDILDNAFVIVDFANGVRAMLDLCMFAEGAHWQETVSVTGDKARLEAFVPGPARFAPDGNERPSEFVISSRNTKREERETIHVDQNALAAGDHHGSTFYQHQRFFELLKQKGQPEVGVLEGLVSVAVGAAAEQSARTGQAVELPVFAG